MRYLLLICDEEKSWSKMSEAEQKQTMGEYRKLVEHLQANGKYVSGSQLQPAATATSVRIRNGKRLLTDGPFAETREQLGGYFLVEAASLDEAVDIAAMIPAAKTGTIEVRPQVPMMVPA